MDPYLPMDVEWRFWLGIHCDRIANQTHSVRPRHSCSIAFVIISNPYGWTYYSCSLYYGINEKNLHSVQREKGFQRISATTSSYYYCTIWPRWMIYYFKYFQSNLCSNGYINISEIVVLWFLIYEHHSVSRLL